MTKFLLLLLALFPAVSQAQWKAAPLDQTGQTNGNGGMISVGNTLIFFNGEKGFLRSTDNGTTWQDVDPNDNGQGGFVSKFAATDGYIWAAKGSGAGTGTLWVSNDDGLTWKLDTAGAQRHALGWEGYAIISNMYAWAGHLFVAWDAPDAFDIKPIGGKFYRPPHWAANDPSSVVAKGDTLFSISSTLTYTTDFGLTWQTPANNNFHPGSLLKADGNRLYMMAPDGFNQPTHLFYTDDNGNNWTKISAAGVSDRQMNLGGLTSIVAHFMKGNNIYLGTQPAVFYNSRPNVFRSTNGGANWFADSAGLDVGYYSSVSYFHYHTDGTVWVVPALDNIYSQKLDDGSSSGGGGLSGTASLLSPKTGSVMQDAKVKFVWSHVSGATKYQLQISKSVEFATLVHNDSSLTDTIATITLTEGETYFWRVRGMATDKIKPKGGGIVQKLSGWTQGYFSISTGRGGWERMGITNVQEIAMHKGAIYVATKTGLIKSTNDGASWISLPSGGIDTMTVRFMTSAEDRLYVGLYHPSGLRDDIMYTTNDGATWTIDSAGIFGAPSFFENMVYWSGHVAARQFGTIYVKALTDPAWTIGTLGGRRYATIGSTIFSDAYKRSNDFAQKAESFTGPKTAGDGEEGIYAFDGKLYAIVQEDTPSDSLSLFVSPDKGDSWSEITLGAFAAPDQPQFGNQLYAPSFLVDGDRMWISVEYGSDLDVVYRSLDAGKTWTIDTAGAWEEFKGAHFNHMYMKDGTVWAVSGGPEMGLGNLYRQRIDPVEQGPELTAPTLLGPTNLAGLSSDSFDFSWSPVSGASSYQLQVTNDTHQENIVQNDSLIVGTTTASKVSGIAPVTHFYWRVRALNGESIGPWSEIWQFDLALESVTAEELNTKITVSPNPATSYVTISSGDLSIAQVMIFDSRGALEGTFENTSTIPLVGIPAGSYTMVIEMRDGNYAIKKLIVR